MRPPQPTSSPPEGATCKIEIDQKALHKFVCKVVLELGAPSRVQQSSNTDQSQQLWDRKTEHNTGFPLCGVETHKALASLVLFSSEKNVLFARNTSPLPRVFTSQDTGLPPNLESVCSTKLRVLAAKFEGRVGGLCLEVSLGTWGPDPVLHRCFTMQNDAEQEIISNLQTLYSVFIFRMLEKILRK